MEIIVLGAGAIGSLYGATLASTNEVTLVGRPDHVRAIEENGLQIAGIENQTVRLRATTRVEKITPNTAILLTTKVPATADALGPIASLVRDDTTIIALQNGWNSEQIARAAVQNRGVVLRGISQFGAIFERAGVIRYMVKGYTLLEKNERSPRIAEVFNRAGLDCRISDDITTEVWRKLTFNCVVNPFTTILRSEVGRIVDPDLDRLKQLVIDECVRVAATQGVSFNTDLLEEINAAYAGSHNIVSMQQDLERGRATEIDYLNGAVVALGAKHGLECPVNDALTKIIKGMEARSRASGAAKVHASTTARG
ncbi:MAG TPA: ketopantoate reductase family protein [Chthoniobacterales bacterium]